LGAPEQNGLFTNIGTNKGIVELEINNQKHYLLLDKPLDSPDMPGLVKVQQEQLGIYLKKKHNTVKPGKDLRTYHLYTHLRDNLDSHKERDEALAKRTSGVKDAYYLAQAFGWNELPDEIKQKYRDKKEVGDFNDLRVDNTQGTRKDAPYLLTTTIGVVYGADQTNDGRVQMKLYSPDEFDNDQIVEMWEAQKALVINDKGKEYVITARVVPARDGREERVDFYKRVYDVNSGHAHLPGDKPLKSTDNYGGDIKKHLVDAVNNQKNTACITTDADLTQESQAVHVLRKGP
jgi:hypothetical protein